MSLPYQRIKITVSNVSPSFSIVFFNSFRNFPSDYFGWGILSTDAFGLVGVMKQMVENGTDEHSKNIFEVSNIITNSSILINVPM